MFVTNSLSDGPTPAESSDIPTGVDLVRQDFFDRPSFLVRLTYLMGVVLPLAGLATGIFLLWGHGFGWVYGGILAGMYLGTAVGVTVGYHRLFTHRAFETNPVVKFILGVLGSMAVEGSILKWVAVHRCHHQHSDGVADPHSPHQFGSSFLNMLRGMWHAHVGWIFQGDPKDLSRYVTDLVRDRTIGVVSKLWGVWAIMGLIIPAVLGGLLTMSWTGVLFGFIWGGLARVFLVHHVTWSINSVCHIWGSRPFRSHDESRNNFVFGVIGLGEGWHNNHHAFPTSARHGLRWWEIDMSYVIIRALAMVGLAWDVRVPNQDRINAKLAT